MHTYDLRTASLNDIVFEGRNKAYGAFVLRQLYHRHLARALAIAVTLSLLLISSPLIYNSLFPPITVASDIIEMPPPVIEPMRPPVFEEPKPAGGPAAQAAVPVVRPPQTAVSKVVPDPQAKPENEVKPQPPTVTPAVDAGSIEPLVTSKGGTGTGTGAATGGTDSGKTAAPAPEPIFRTAEVMPQFVGGQEALLRYMQKNLRYPPQALRNNIDGRVFISFTVQADGSIADVEVVKGLGFGTDEEAARVVKNMPPWTPGRQNKHNVAVRYTMPITFRYE